MTYSETTKKTSPSKNRDGDTDFGDKMNILFGRRLQQDTPTQKKPFL